MYDILLVLGGFYQGYRAFQDAGGWFFLMDVEARMEYMQALLTSKGLA